MSVRVGALHLRLRILCAEVPAIGPGKADLLAAIDAEGSIAAAGRALGMSYRRAWLLVDEMNRCFRVAPVATLSGGGRERGARLTDEGRALLAAYRALEADAARLADTPAYATLAAAIRNRPLDPEG